jgi:hypothetical protein
MENDRMTTGGDTLALSAPALDGDEMVGFMLKRLDKSSVVLDVQLFYLTITKFDGQKLITVI